MPDQGTKKGTCMTVRKCVSKSHMNIIIIIDVRLCSGKDEQAASSNPGGGSSTKETTPTDTPTAGESGSNSISKTAESYSNNAEPTEPH